jgi:hypothetical protein
MADIPCNAVMARTWMFGMAAATRTGLCLADFRTDPSIIDTDGRPLSDGVESAGRKPCAVTDLNSVKRFHGFAALKPFIRRTKPHS